MIGTCPHWGRESVIVKSESKQSLSLPKRLIIHNHQNGVVWVLSNHVEPRVWRHAKTWLRGFAVIFVPRDTCSLSPREEEIWNPQREREVRNILNNTTPSTIFSSLNCVVRISDDDVFRDILVLVLPLQPLRPCLAPPHRRLSRLRRRLHRRNRTPAPLRPPRPPTPPPSLPRCRHVHDRTTTLLRPPPRLIPPPHPPQRRRPLPLQPRHRPPRRRGGRKSRLWTLLRRRHRFRPPTPATKHVRVSSRIWLR